MMKSREKQTGFALLLVMMLLAMSVVLGLSYLSVASMKVASSSNYVTSAKAKYLAESGLEHAMYLVQSKASLGSVSSPLGPFYIDNSQDNYVLYGQTTGVTGQYHIVATGSSGKITQVSEALVSLSASPTISINQGLLLSTSMDWLPCSLTVNGDIYVNGSLWNNADINGKASATGCIIDLFHMIQNGVTNNASPVAPPALAGSDYQDYVLYNTTYHAVDLNSKTLNNGDSLTNGGAITSNNPAGVINGKGSGKKLTLSHDVNFVGTLIVDKDLTIDGANVTITPVAGFPAIVADRILLTNNARVTINGAVISNQGFVASDCDGSPCSRSTVNGCLVSNGGYDTYLGGSHTLNYRADLSKLYDVRSNSSGPSTIKIDGWIK